MLRRCHCRICRNGLPKIVLWGLLMTVLMLAFVVTVLLAPQHALSCAMTSNPPGSPAHFPPKSAPAWMGGLTKDEFVNAVLRAPVEGLPDVAAIRQKCEHDTKWQPGLVWFCAPVNPGLVNALISVLDCLRYALEAGATTIVFPGVTRRSHNNLTEVGSEDDDDWSNPPSVFFDVPFFTEVWGKACPEMHTIAWQPRMKDLPGGKDSIFIHPPHIAPFEFDGRMPVNANAWRPAFDIWMVDHANAYATMSPEKPLRLYQAKTILEFNPRADPLPFMHTFARSVRFSMQARRLAASALWELGRIVGHPLAPVSATEAAAYSSAARDALEGPNVPNVNELQPGRLTKPGFMGVHLRTEVDVPDLWLPYRAQAAAYINEARQRRMRFVVVATGSAEELEEFRFQVSQGPQDDHAIKVLSKHDLLTPEDLVELQSMDFDQQAIVDFELLMRSEFFCGMTYSSFAWEIALRRALLPEAGESTPTDSEAFRDSLSMIVGKTTNNLMPKGLWP